MPAIGAAIGAIVSSITAGGFLTSIVGRLLITVAASALLRALQPKPKPPGIRTDVTMNGGVNPCAFVLMGYATSGQRVCPPMSHGNVGKTPNAYLTEVIELGDIAGQTLSRVIINDQYVTLGSTPDPTYGFPVLGELNGFCWVKYYDGTQTAADPMLISKYASYPERPWSADMIGRGICYAIITCRFSREKWNSAPRFRFEMGGIPLYDPRKDSTVGGSGGHRWNNKATWEQTTNPAVAIYNILRGISLDDGSIWGGGFPAEDLPNASWFAGMNECDVLVGNGIAGTEPQYRAGYEVSVDDEPADVIAELLKACSGQISETGGLWKIRIGAPGLPVYSITDGDIVITSTQDYTPFPGFTSSFNAIHASYPEPAMLWEPKEAPPIYNSLWEAQDQGQRLVADLSFPAVPYGAQVRRVSAAYIAEERRFRRHGLTLPPDAAVLEPLDTLDWTSIANPYSAKVFEISELADDLMTGLQTVALRERDPADYVSANPAPPSVPSLVTVIPAVQTVPSFAVAGISIPDGSGNLRRPAIQLAWEPDLDDVRSILFEVRLQATGVVIAQGSFQDVASGVGVVSEGILPSLSYGARVRPLVDRPSAWSSWVSATSPNVQIGRLDLSNGAVTDIVQAVVLGPFTGISTPAGTVINTLDLGARSIGPPLQLGVQFEANKILAGNPNGIIELQSRYRINGGAFTAWATDQTFTVTTTGYDLFSAGRTIFGQYDDYEVRLIVNTRPANSASQWLRNTYLSAYQVVK